MHLIESTSRSGLDVHSSRFALSSMIHAKFRLTQDACMLVGLACGACNIATLCSALAVTLDKKEACFLWPRRAVQQGKKIITMVQLQYLVLTYNRSCPQCKCDKPQNSLLAMSW